MKGIFLTLVMIFKSNGLTDVAQRSVGLGVVKESPESFTLAPLIPECATLLPIFVLRENKPNQ